MTLKSAVICQFIRCQQAHLAESFAVFFDEVFVFGCSLIVILVRVWKPAVLILTISAYAPCIMLHFWRQLSHELIATTVLACYLVIHIKIPTPL